MATNERYERSLAIIRRSPLVTEPRQHILSDLTVWESLEVIAEVANISLRKPKSSPETVDIAPVRCAMAIKNLGNLGKEDLGWVTTEGVPYKMDDTPTTYSLWFNGSAGKKCILAVYVEPVKDVKSDHYYGKITIARRSSEGVSIEARIYDTYSEEETLTYICGFLFAEPNALMLRASSTREGGALIGPAFSKFKQLFYPDARATMV